MWPPYLGEGEATPSIERPVEEVALNRVMVVCITELMQSVLSERQRTILIRTFVDHTNGRAIALELGISLANVYQLRHRALRRLLRALTF
jgi:DNA-directed RNA polymerase specialized sigma subunit